MIVVILFGQKLKQKTRKRLQLKIVGSYVYFVVIRTGWPDLLSVYNTLSLESSASFSYLKSLVCKSWLMEGRKAYGMCANPTPVCTSWMCVTVHSTIHTLQCKGNMRTYTWRIRCATDYIKTLQIKTLQFDRQGLL